MTQRYPQGGILTPDEVMKAQNEMNQGMTASSVGSGGQGGSGGNVKPGDKIKAQEAMAGVQSGGMVEAADKVEAQNKMF